MGKTGVAAECISVAAIYLCRLGSDYLVFGKTQIVRVCEEAGTQPKHQHHEGGASSLSAQERSRNSRHAKKLHAVGIISKNLSFVIGHTENEHTQDCHVASEVAVNNWNITGYSWFLQ